MRERCMALSSKQRYEREMYGIAWQAKVCERDVWH